MVTGALDGAVAAVVATICSVVSFAAVVLAAVVGATVTCLCFPSWCSSFFGLGSLESFFLFPATWSLFSAKAAKSSPSLTVRKAELLQLA